jgi:uncharacterized coiled-coil DUF342 family protein
MSGTDLDTLAKMAQVRRDFLKVDLQMALTFTQIALQTADPARKQRAIRSARKAYLAITRFLPETSLTPEDAGKVASNLERLKHELQALGEVLEPAI